MPRPKSVQQLVVLGVLAATAVCGCGKPPPPTVVKTTKGQDIPTVQIAIRSYPDRGGSWKRREINEQSVAEKVIDAKAGVLLNQIKRTMSHEVEYVDLVQEPGPSQPKLLRRNYLVAFDKIDGEVRKLPYAERVIVFEFKDGKYEATALGPPPISPDELAMLARRVSRPDLIQLYLPTKPVAEGESWTINVARAAPVLADGTDVDASRSSGTGKLTKAYMKPGSRSLYGVIDFDLKFAVVNRVFQGKQKLAWEPGTFLEFKGTIDTAIDGTTAEGTVAVKGKFSGKSRHFVMKDKNVSVESLTEFSSRQERTPEK